MTPETATRGGPEITASGPADEAIFATFEGFVDRVEDGIVYLTLEDERSERWYAEESTEALGESGIDLNHGKLRCEFLATGAGGSRARWTPLPKRVPTADEERIIRESIARDLADYHDDELA